MRWEMSERREAGFTLVELLVVVAIVGVLAGLLLPVLAKAKSQARRAQCVSAQRQLLLTWALYSTDHNEALVANGHGEPGAAGTPRMWVAGDNHFYLPSYTNTDFLVNPEYAAFAPYVSVASLYKCPEDHATVKRGAGAAMPQIRSYAMNGYMGWSTDPAELTAGYRVYRRSSDLNGRSPADLFVFQEVHPNSICMPAFMVYMPGGEVDGFYHYPSSLHRGGAVVGFADGHVTTHRWEDARTRRPVTAGMLAHWDRSPNNRDTRWLREHATEATDLAVAAAVGAGGAGATSTAAGEGY